ncbi:MAG: ATP-binding cassette domain-containing protein [Deltaproteobacteria bacterium]|nr:ATP-binding cassette domain-containing protein [Deltaproteobacteria bacterium]
MAYVCVNRAVKFFPREDGSQMLVLDGVSFEATEHGITCLLGPSGCGKSTLLNAIAGLEKLDQGEIEFRVSNSECRVMDRKNPKEISEPGTRNSELPGRSPKLGYVFQDPRLLNWKRVEDNLVFAFKGMKIPRESWQALLEKYLSLVGLLSFRKQYPLYLSGGMRQRVGLARGLAIEPEILLMDEPFSKLDQLTARQLRQDTVDICARLGQTTMLVTHDVEEAAYMGDRIVIFSSRPAHIVEVVDNPLEATKRDLDDLAFIRFKKRLLQTVLKLVDQEGV